MSGIMRATGKQLFVAVINFFCYYIVGLPIGITLALVFGFKAKGVWLGLSIGDLFQVNSLSFCLKLLFLVHITEHLYHHPFFHHKLGKRV